MRNMPSVFYMGWGRLLVVLVVGRVGGGSCWWVSVLLAWCGCGVLRALGWCALLRRLAFAHGDYNYQCSVAIVVRHEPLSQEHTIY